MTSEYGYRKEFEVLLEDIFYSGSVKKLKTEIEHDAKTRSGNKPDFVVTNNSVPILYIETKDIGVSLDKVEQSSQMARYYGYENLVLTDYLEFRFYRNGQKYGEPIAIATYDKKNRSIIQNQQHFELLQRTLVDFTLEHKEPIKSGFHLSKIMGGKAQRIRENVLELLKGESTSANSDDLKKVYETIKHLLVHDLTVENFADMYAQTLVYGLFVARYNDSSPNTFTRSEARDLIPASNPFLRHFFDHIAGASFPKRLEYIVDELCEVFSYADIEKLMKDYYQRGKSKNDKIGPDPVIHFFEDFLKEYDPALRKKMGAYYTPQPIVQFIIRSVDEILKKDFGLRDGLADISKTEHGVHKVQVLDPATGTGTFYSKVIGHIYKTFKDNKQEGRWPKYVHNDLLPRIHGFELMMAPYTIAHLKLSMAFKETGFKYFNDRLGVYLTNSLEDTEGQQNLLSFGFAESIANESKEAAKIKKQTPIMVVVGNPPYSVSSSNKGKWITDELKEYKKDLNEKNIQPLSDDYIKFVRFAEHFVEKNNSGIVAMITNNSFIDGIIHRQMRKHLLETFDDIYILDLHGNSKKKETAHDGSKDENVFDIMQGVSINIFVKKEKSNSKLAALHHFDLYGKREHKFNTLNENSLSTIKWKNINYSKPHYFFVPKDFGLIEEYESGFKVNDLFRNYSSCYQTEKDDIAVHKKKSDLEKLLLSFKNDSKIEILEKFNLKNTNAIGSAIDDIKSNEPVLLKYDYKYFDKRYTAFTGKTNGFIGRPRTSVSKFIVNHENISLILMKQSVDADEFNTVSVSKTLVDKNYYGFQTYFFPVFEYSNDGLKAPNFNQKIADKIEISIGKYAPEELFDYIYAVLHSSTYRGRYKEFLKIDFPCIPYPTDRKLFDNLVKLGTELRETHLMESDTVQNFSLPFPEMGDDTVDKIRYVGGSLTSPGRAYINETQYFGEVPETAWNFYIGGYQPAQKWLKDRKGQVLENEDIEHYQRIIKALMETNRLMKEIDKLIPKWPI